MAPDKRLEHFMPAESHERAVVGMRPEISGIVGVGAVFEARGVVVGVNSIRLLLAHHLAQIPEFGCLIFTVGQHVTPVALAVDVCQALGVAQEDAGFAAVAHGAPVPYFEGCVV